jgi:hypothetical protein
MRHVTDVFRQMLCAMMNRVTIWRAILLQRLPLLVLPVDLGIGEWCTGYGQLILYCIPK